jgi:hypothetical protein
VEPGCYGCVPHVVTVITYVLIVVLLSVVKRSIFQGGIVFMQPIPEDDSMARLQVDIDEELKTRLKLHAVRQDKTMSDIVELAVAAYLDKVEKAGK